MGYSSHTISTSLSGPAHVELAWTDLAENLALYLLPGAAGSTAPLQRQLMVFSSSLHGMRQEVTFLAKAHAPFDVLVDSHANRPLAYAITITTA